MDRSDIRRVRRSKAVAPVRKGGPVNLHPPDARATRAFTPVGDERVAR
jgi:hypothetical protein